MSSPVQPLPPTPSLSLTPSTVTVLLVDDQAIVGEAVRRMLAGESDIAFHHCGDPTKALEQANAIAPTVILQDLVMPDIDGLTLVKFFRANPRTRDIPLIVLSSKEEPVIKAQAFALGANDYLVKLPDKVELIARIRYHSQAYIRLLERNEAYRKLEESQKHLAAEVAQAAKYVRSLLPPPLRDHVKIDWKFIPSEQLGGDSFGYNWLDPDHLAMYLLDVSGHGVGASLMSVSAMNVLGALSLPNTDFRQPGQVLKALNESFPMEKHDFKFFTIWYGVYELSTRKLTYSGAGHPPALLFTGPNPASAPMHKLASDGAMIGAWGGDGFGTGTITLDAYARLFIYSDGIFEIERPDQTIGTLEEFIAFLQSLPAEEPDPMDRIMTHITQVQGTDVLRDDCSIMQVTF